jgi:hypothetical protein
VVVPVVLVWNIGLWVEQNVALTIFPLECMQLLQRKSGWHFRRLVVHLQPTCCSVAVPLRVLPLRAGLPLLLVLLLALRMLLAGEPIAAAAASAGTAAAAGSSCCGEDTLVVLRDLRLEGSCRWELLLLLAQA